MTPTPTSASTSSAPRAPTFRVVGPGRAGGSLGRALSSQGWSWIDSLGRNDDKTAAAAGVDVVLLAVPDDAIAGVAQAIAPGTAVLLHLSGAKSTKDLAHHPRHGSVHPLVSLPDPEIGAQRLLDGAIFAVAGDPLARSVVEAVGGTAIEVPDQDRARYHAAATVAANHLVALCAQVERLADTAGVPVSAYWSLMASTIDNVAATSPAEALTGPAARGDLETIARHLAAIDPTERPLYLALADAAARLADQPTPSILTSPDDAGPDLD